MGLKKENFAIFEDGIQRDVTNFSTPEAPITVAVVMEYSKLGQEIGYYGSSGTEAGQLEVLRPMAAFLSQFIKPPDDYVSVIAYDMRPTPLTDFTNDPGRINQVRSEEHTSELQSRQYLVCRLLLEKKKKYHMSNNGI